MENYPEDVARHFEVVTTGANEIAIVYVDERVATVLRPAERKLFAKGVHRIRAERFEIVDNLDVDGRLAKRLVAGKDARLKVVAGEFIYARIVPEGHIGLLYVDGELERALAPGFHAFFAVERGVTVEIFDTRVNTLEVSGQEILTKDKVSLRINVTATYRSPTSRRRCAR